VSEVALLERRERPNQCNSDLFDGIEIANNFVAELPEGSTFDVLPDLVGATVTAPMGEEPSNVGAL